MWQKVYSPQKYPIWDFDLELVTNLLVLDSNFEGNSWDREKARDVLIGLGYGIKWNRQDKEYTYRPL